MPFVVGSASLIVTLLPLAVLRRVTGAVQEFTPLRGWSARCEPRPS